MKDHAKAPRTAYDERAGVQTESEPKEERAYVSPELSRLGRIETVTGFSF